MKYFYLSLLVLIFSSNHLSAQKEGIIQGIAIDKNTQETLIGVTFQVEQMLNIGTVSDSVGKYSLKIPVGSYNIIATSIGYKPLTKFNVVVTTGNSNLINFEMEADQTDLKEVKISVNRSIAVATLETPLSTQKLTAEEIRNNPGANFDISRVVQSLPGVGIPFGSSSNGPRNDIIIRGGSPNENVFYLDGIEIPVLNHFQTQGSSGGPQGILNVNFIEDVQLSTSAFEARYDNPLSSVFQFKQRSGNAERYQGSLRLSGTELAGTYEGPVSKNTTFLVSARKSYIDQFFKLLDIGIRPKYWDFQYKVQTKLDSKTTITAIGLGAIDNFSIGSVNKNTPEQEYLRREAPFLDQWNYTVGFTLKRLVENGYFNISLSRNAFDNNVHQYSDPDNAIATNLTFNTQSRETENKLRFDMNKYFGGWKLSYGAMAQYEQFTNSIFEVVQKESRDAKGNIIQPAINVNYNGGIDFVKYGAFGQISKSFNNDQYGFSFGARTDMNTFTTDGNNPLKTFAPRLSGFYALSDKLKINASIGRYSKIPVYTILGYRDANNNLVNQNADYTLSTHYVVGLEYILRTSTRFTLEAFYKDYSNYPVSVISSTSIANIGSDYNIVGNEAIKTVGGGKTYGVEFFYQQKLIEKIYSVVSMSVLSSEFSGTNGILAPSSWDSRFIFSGLLGRKFKDGWEMGLKYRFATGTPYTPFDESASRTNYYYTGAGTLDYAKLNTLRLGNFQQFDFRLDKFINFRKTTFDLYLDVANAFVLKSPQNPVYHFERTEDGKSFKTTDNKPLNPNGSNAVVYIEPTVNKQALIIPSLGFLWQF